MNKQVRIILVILCVIIIWVILAVMNAGVIGLGVILSFLAVLDIANGKFTGSNKTAWLIIALAALFIAIIGIASVHLRISDNQGNNHVYTLCTIISIILPMAYFITGRRQKINSGEKDNQVGPG